MRSRLIGLPFTIHHIGARFGTVPFDIPAAFHRDLSFVFYDADKDCVEGLMERGSTAEFEERVVHACLADAEGEAEFRTTINPSASSLLEPSVASRGFVQPMLGIDWDVYDCARVVERRRLATTSLDALLRVRNDIPDPDFVSLDTQGSEFAILEGALATVRRGMIGLIVEVEFVDLYDNVKRFGDIAKLMETEGFFFCGFLHIIDAQASRQPIGLRSQGFPVAADALFLRRLDRMGGIDAAQFWKLAFAALVFGHLDYVFAALDAADSPAAPASSEAWSTLLSDLRAAAQRSHRVNLPRFPDILRPHEVSRFSREPDPAQWPSMMELSTWVRDQFGDRSIDAILDDLEQTADTPVEQVIRANGFAPLADETNFARRDQTYKLRQLLRASGTLP